MNIQDFRESENRPQMTPATARIPFPKCNSRRTLPGTGAVSNHSAPSSNFNVEYFISFDACSLLTANFRVTQ